MNTDEEMQKKSYFKFEKTSQLEKNNEIVENNAEKIINVHISPPKSGYLFSCSSRNWIIIAKTKSTRGPPFFASIID